MILSVLHFLPFFTCLIWLVMFKFRKKNATQKRLMLVTGFASFYFLVFAFYISPNTNYEWMCRLDLINEFVILFALAAVASYVFMYWKGRNMSKTMRLLLDLPAIVHGSVVALLQYMIGIDRAALIYKVIDVNLEGPGDALRYEFMKEYLNNDVEVLFWLFSMVMINIVAFLYLVSILVMCFMTSVKLGYKFGDFSRFMFKGHESTPSRIAILCIGLICLSLAVIAITGRAFMYNNPMYGMSLCIMVTLFVFWLEYAEYCNHMKVIYLQDLLHLDFGVGKHRLREEAEIQNVETRETKMEEVPTVEVVDRLPIENGEIDLLSLDSEARNILITKLEDLMEQKKLFKDPMLSRDTLASALGTNRTTVSSLLNKVYGVSLSTYIGNYRIEAAKMYMKRYPTATLDEVAIECGFKDATAFCHKFKEVEGVTAKKWLYEKGKKRLGG